MLYLGGHVSDVIGGLENDTFAERRSLDVGSRHVRSLSATNWDNRLNHLGQCHG